MSDFGLHVAIERMHIILVIGDVLDIDILGAVVSDIERNSVPIEIILLRDERQEIGACIRHEVAAIRGVPVSRRDFFFL